MRKLFFILYFLGLMALFPCLNHGATVPFGSFDTPVNGSTVATSIAVTGWALDETSVR
ncbi:MAG: hypothetical protein GY757_27720, partial [bacterium]|nr:hypothetical protein [bacterium]